VPRRFHLNRQGFFVFYIAESSKSFYEAGLELDPIVQRHGFVILNTHDLSETLRRKGIGLDDDCQVFEICNYRLAEKMLAIDMRFSLLVPWRISIFTENGATKIGLIRPTPIQQGLLDHPELSRIAREIEEKMIQIIDEVR
jgi:uncharacterized protein (DUF302 family)